MRKVSLYIACSVDGFIAAPGDNLDFLDVVQKEGEDYGYTEFISGIDTIIQGRRTYDWVKAKAPDFSHADRQVFVITRTPRDPAGSVIFYTGDPVRLLEDLRVKEGRGIFIDGGATVANFMLRKDLIDELVISLIPVLLGDGIRLFEEGRQMAGLELVNSRSFDTGLVQLTYRRKTGPDRDHVNISSSSGPISHL